MIKGLYKLHVDCGRQGTLYGVYIANVEDMNKLIEQGTELYFGEVLGKHSEIYGALDEKDFTLVTTDEAVIEMFDKYDLESGFNPFHYLPEVEEDSDNE